MSAHLSAVPSSDSQLNVAEALLAALGDTTTEPRADTQLEALTLAVTADLPVLLWGEPGIGKTAALTRLAEALDLPLTTVIASVHEPSDFSGLPVVGDDPAVQGVPMAPPDWAVRLVRAGRGLLFLDELSTAPPAVQAALLRLVLERRVGALTLPPGVRIVAAANPRSSAADGWELSPPLANRFVHLQWTHDHDVVVRGLGGTWPHATLPRLRPERLPESVAFARRAVCGFLTARPGLVHRLPDGESRRGGAWPSPRSWEATLRLIAFATAAGSSRDVLSLLVRGTVGDGPGLELLASLDRMDLPDPEELLADPAGAELPQRGDLRQAVLDGVVDAVRKRPERARWDAAWALLVRAMETGAPDVVVVPATTLASLRQGDWDVPAAIERLAGAVSLSRRADEAARRAALASPGAPVTAGTTGALDLGKLFAARLHAARVRPYLATALFALHPVESRRVPTMAVDRYWRVYVSPAFVARTPVEELAGVWVHEVTHLLRDHHGRSDRVARERGLTGPAQLLRMNIAADCEINDDVYGDGLVPPEGAVTPGTLGLPQGELLEDYLRQFRLGPWLARLAWLDCGSGADGLGREWDLGPDGAHGLSDQERDAVRFRVAQGINGRPGDAPKSWRRWAREVFHPPQPWRELLGAALRSAVSGPGADGDYSYGRPARRSAGLPGVLLPSLRRRPPRVCVVVDTSGSVSDEELGSALLEVAAISRAVGGRRDLVSVLSCDAAARRVQPVCRAEGIELVGGGGTDLRTGFARALRTRPDVVVVLTDGRTPWPQARPACRTVVGLFPRAAGSWDEDDPDHRPDPPPAWARVVTIGSPPG